MVKVGQIVKVQVLSADAKTKRIALSMKALHGTGSRGVRPAGVAVQGPLATKNPGRPAVKAQVQAPLKAPVSFDDKLAMLTSKFKGR